MKQNTTHLPVSIAGIFLWIGFVSAISFMEAWLKFRAPGISVPLGLGIGRIVFSALNSVEIILALAILAEILFRTRGQLTLRHFPFIIPFSILTFQTLWLLPALDSRAELVLNDLPTPPSNLHFYYIILEIIKVTSLIVWGVILLKNKTSK